MFHHRLLQHATCGTQHATCSTQHATRKHASTQHAARNTQHATRNMQQATRNTQHAASNPQHATRNMQARGALRMQHATRSTQARSTRGTPHACSWSWKMDGRWSFSAFEYFLPSPSAVSCASQSRRRMRAPLNRRHYARVAGQGKAARNTTGQEANGGCPYCRLGKVEVLLILVALPKRTRADTACGAAHSGRDVATNRCFAESRETIESRKGP